MNRLLYFVGLFFVNLVIYAYGDPATNSPPINTPVQDLATQASATLSAQTLAVLNQTQNLTSAAQSILDNQLIDIPKQVLADAKSGNSDPVKHLITQQYLSALTGMTSLDPGVTIDQAVLGDFEGYSIIGIDRVIIQKGVAFVDARIVYLPTRLPDVIADEQKRAANKNDQGGTIWTNFGGSSSTKVYEKLGVGRATYYLVVQGGLWRLHYTYFSLDPLTPHELKLATENMQTLIQ